MDAAEVYLKAFIRSVLRNCQQRSFWQRSSVYRDWGMAYCRISCGMPESTLVLICVKRQKQISRRYTFLSGKYSGKCVNAADAIRRKICSEIKADILHNLARTLYTNHVWNAGMKSVKQTTWAERCIFVNAARRNKFCLAAFAKQVTLSNKRQRFFFR